MAPEPHKIPVAIFADLCVSAFGSPVLSYTAMEFQENVPLAPFTTLHIGGPARFLARIASHQDLLQAIEFAHRNHLPIFTLGGGSNLLVADEGFPGLVLQIAFPESIALTQIRDATLVEVSAGTDWDALILYFCQKGIAGLECLAGIPGLTGGAPIQNIGAYGQEVSQTIDSVTALDLLTLNSVDFTRDECRFSYRHSLFNSTHRNRFIVTSVRFRLPHGASPNLTYADLAPLRNSNPTPLDVYHFVRATRARKGMLLDLANPTPDTRSAGSFFKNPIVPARILNHIAETLNLDPTKIPHWPVAFTRPETQDPGGTVPESAQRGTEPRIKLPAAWLIEQAGFPKGFRPTPESSVGVSTLHTLALTNRTGTATHAALTALRDEITQTIKARFGVTLEQEPVNVP